MKSSVPLLLPSTKSLPPLPVHPHCLCRYVEVIEGEVDMQQQRDQVREAGDKWLNSLPESRRVQVLGRKGLKAWKDGEDWRKYMRGYAGLREVESRLNESILKRRRIGTQGQQIIDKATYSKLVKEFLNDGGIIIRGEEADRFLEKQGAYASYLVGSKIAFISDGATVSDVLEEMYHAKQDRRGDYNNLIFDEMILRREIDAQKYLLRMSEKYKIPIEETQVTTQNLKTYQLKLQEFLKQGGEPIMSTKYKIIDSLKVPHTKDLTILVLDRDYQIEGIGIAIIDNKRFHYMPNSVKRWITIHTTDDFKDKVVTIV